jgi:hypothetical protein
MDEIENLQRIRRQRIVALRAAAGKKELACSFCGQPGRAPRCDRVEVVFG